MPPTRIWKLPGLSLVKMIATTPICNGGNARSNILDSVPGRNLDGGYLQRPPRPSSQVKKITEPRTCVKGRVFLAAAPFLQTSAKKGS